MLAPARRVVFKAVVLFSHLGWYLAVYATGNLGVETAATEINEVMRSEMPKVTGAGKYMATFVGSVGKEEKKAGDFTQVREVVRGRKTEDLIKPAGTNTWNSVVKVAKE